MVYKTNPSFEFARVCIEWPKMPEFVKTNKLDNVMVKISKHHNKKVYKSVSPHLYLCKERTLKLEHSFFVLIKDQKLVILAQTFLDIDFFFILFIHFLHTLETFFCDYG